MDVRGQIAPMKQLFDGLRSGLMAGGRVILLLLAANFQSVRLALVVISTVPAVICGGVVALVFTALDTEHPELHRHHHGRRRLRWRMRSWSVDLRRGASCRRQNARQRARHRGCEDSLRPVLMTSLAMIAGMVPMALGLGEGGAHTAPLGRAVIGGLTAATVTTLLVVPVIYALAQRSARQGSPSLNPLKMPESVA